MDRPKHPKKDLEGFLKEVEAHGWQVTKPPRGYFKCKCSCPEKHMKWVALTPSGARYLNNLRAWFKHQPCWEDQ